MVVINHDIYLRDPIGAKFADVVFPACDLGRRRLSSVLTVSVVFVSTRSWLMHRVSPSLTGGLSGRWPSAWVTMAFDWKDSNEVCEESSRFSRGNRKAYHMIKVAAHKEGQNPA